jgi:hypothetical protein
MSKSMKVLVLAGILSIAAASGVQAGGHSTSGDFHASAAPACDTHRCQVLATEGPPRSAGDNNGRSMASATIRSGQIPGLWRPVLAGGGKVGSDFHANAAPGCDTDRCPVLASDGPGSLTDGTGRSAALSQGGGEYRVAASASGAGGDISR